ncbi:MAG: polysaccharide biosynthesis/export family protein [Ignavibacteriales bacterium]|nr:polysaccharide biosynthesis/export family protein [Ignavibacteriales bacterium]
MATAGWTRYAFDATESAWRDAESVEVAGGFRFPLTGRARGTVLFGWKSFRPDSPDRRALLRAHRRDRGLSAPRAAWPSTLGYDRDNAFSYNESAYYYIDGRARAGLSLYLAPFLRIDGGDPVRDDDLPRTADGLVRRRARPRSTAGRTPSATSSVGPVVRIARDGRARPDLQYLQADVQRPGLRRPEELRRSVPDLRILAFRPKEPTMSKTFTIAGLFLAALALAAAAPAAQASSPAVSAAQDVSAEYKIGPKDLLEISVLGVPEISKLVVRVSEEGRITLPLLGEVERRRPDQVRGGEEAGPARRREDRPQAPGHRPHPRVPQPPRLRRRGGGQARAVRAPRPADGPVRRLRGRRPDPGRGRGDHRHPPARGRGEHLHPHLHRRALRPGRSQAQHRPRAGRRHQRARRQDRSLSTSSARSGTRGPCRSGRSEPADPDPGHRPGRRLHRPGQQEAGPDPAEGRLGQGARDHRQRPEHPQGEDQGHPPEGQRHGLRPGEPPLARDDRENRHERFRQQDGTEGGRPPRIRPGRPQAQVGPGDVRRRPGRPRGRRLVHPDAALPGHGHAAHRRAGVEPAQHPGRPQRRGLLPQRLSWAPISTPSSGS